MRSTLWWVVVGLSACADKGGEGEDTHVETDTTSPTTTATTSTNWTIPSTSTSAEGVEASCELQADNNLRFDCTVTLSEEGALELIAFDEEGWTRTFESESSGDHAVTMWGFLKQTKYGWRAEVNGEIVASGSVTTKNTPSELRAIEFNAEGEDSSADGFLIPTGCPTDNFLVVVNPAGDVLWYEPLDGTIEVVQWTDDGTFLMLAERAQIWELTPGGEEVFRVSRGSDFDLPIHHDAFKRNGYVYALNGDAFENDAGEEFVLDGFYVFDASGALVGEWSLSDHLGDIELSGEGAGMGGFWGHVFPGAIDFSHANGIYVDEEGDIYISFRWFDGVFRVEADPEESDFGEVRWRLLGSSDLGIAGDFSMTTAVGGEANLDGQHHPALTEDGSLTVYDNRHSPEATRTVRMELDESAGVATIVETHELPKTCDVQGGYYVLPDGGALATCPMDMEFYTFASDEPEDYRYKMDVECADSGRVAPMARVIPMEL